MYTKTEINLSDTAEYFAIIDKDSFNAPIRYKNGLFARIEAANVNSSEDVIIGPYAHKHEQRHIIHRRIIEDLLKEDPKVFEYFKQDIKRTESKKYFLAQIANKLIGTKNKKGFKNLEKIIESIKTEEDVIKHAKSVSTHMLLSYWDKNAGILENFADEGANKITAGIAASSGIGTIIVSLDCLYNSINQITVNLEDNFEIGKYITLVKYIALGVFAALVSKDALNLAKASSADCLSKKKLEKFSPKQRKYLVALPSMGNPEERLAEMRAYGLNV